MLKGEAGRRADRTLSYGHFTRSATDHYVFCPECRTRVAATTKAWDKGRAIERALRGELVDHLVGGCEA